MGGDIPTHGVALHFPNKLYLFLWLAFTVVNLVWYFILLDFTAYTACFNLAIWIFTLGVFLYTA